MAVDVVIPHLGESITEAEIVRWLKANGDEVTVDEPIAEVETDKATSELPCPASGILEIVVAEGTTVKPGDVVARIQESKGKAAAKPAPAAVPKKEAPAAREPVRDPVREAEPRSVSEARGPATAATSSVVQTRGSAPSDAGNGGEPAELSPAVRRLVEEKHLDPSAIRASGRGGRLTKEDVLAHLREGNAEAAPPEPTEPAEPTDAAETAEPAARDDKAARLSLVRGPSPAPQAPSAAPAAPSSTSQAPSRPPAAPKSGPEPDEERVRMSRLRRSIAQRLVEAQHTAAILTTFNEIDMTRVMETRSKFKDKFAQAHGVSLGFMSFFARACVLAVKDVPVVNARIEGEEIVYSRRVHLGIAASTERGLVVPVVRNADSLTMAELEREVGRLAELARTGRIGLDDLTGGTFTISNGGVFGSLMSTPILNPPQSAILGMHKIEKRPVAIDEQIVVRPMMYVALSYDHRLIDGREAVTFLVRVKERLEDPERLLLEI